MLSSPKRVNFFSSFHGFMSFLIAVLRPFLLEMQRRMRYNNGKSAGQEVEAKNGRNPLTSFFEPKISICIQEIFHKKKKTHFCANCEW